MKRNLRLLFWLSVSALVAVGCADNRNDSSVSYRPGLSDNPILPRRVLTFSGRTQPNRQMSM